MTSSYPNTYRLRMLWDVVAVAAGVWLLVHNGPYFGIHNVGTMALVSAVSIMMLVTLAQLPLNMRFLDRYSYADAYLEMVNPISSRHSRINLNDIREVRRFFVLRTDKPTRWLHGCVLVGGDGSEIAICELLPIYREIIARTEAIPTTWQPFYKRWHLV